MEGRSAEGVVVTLGPARGQAEESELNGWLIDTHFAEVMASGVFNHAVRLVNPEATAGSVEGTANDIDAKTTRFLTMYETSRDDVAAAWRENTARNADLRKQGRITQISPHSSTSHGAARIRRADHRHPRRDDGFQRRGGATGVPTVVRRRAHTGDLGNRFVPHGHAIPERPASAWPP